MSRTKRKFNGDSNNPPREFNDGELTNLSKDKNPKKSFVYRGDGIYTKAQGGPGNKRGWKNWMPKWLYKKLNGKELL